MTLADQIASNFQTIAGNTGHLAETCTYTAPSSAPQNIGLLIFGHDPLAETAETIGAARQQGRLYALASALTLPAPVLGATVLRKGTVYTVDGLDAIGSHAWRLHLRASTPELRVPGRVR
jgi:hypothetical protein